MFHPISSVSPAQKRKKNVTFLLSGLLLIAICFSLSTKAQGDLLVFPKRIVFENSRKSQTINLSNTSKDTARYTISFVQIRMKEDGSVENITKPDSGQLFADSYLRFFPRSVTLAPNESQSVKVQLVKTGELKPGEYRSHLYLRAVPASTPLGEKETLADSSAISIKLTPVFGITMAAIIRIGENDAKVQISEASLNLGKDTVPVLHLAFNRSGNMSVYGDLSVEHISRQGKVTTVGTAKGLAVYTPNTVRRFRLALDKGVNYHSGKLRVVYADQSPKALVLAEKEIELK